MAKKFIVVTQPMTSDQEREFLKFLGDDGWWHRVPNLWLIDTDRDLVVRQIAEEINRISPQVNALVTECTVENWCLVHSANTFDRAYDWLSKYWINPK